MGGCDGPPENVVRKPYDKAPLEVKDLGPIKVDGKLNEAAWSNAVFHEGFVYISGPTEGLPQSEFAVSFDKEKVYFAVRCFDDDIANIVAPKRAKADRRRDDDLIEFFINADGKNSSYIQLLLTAGNFQQEVLGTHATMRRRSDFT
ncbi:unnamed protein product, partial [marine sediment metagenome]